MTKIVKLNREQTDMLLDSPKSTSGFQSVNILLEDGRDFRKMKVKEGCIYLNDNDEMFKSSDIAVMICVCI